MKKMPVVALVYEIIYVVYAILFNLQLKSFTCLCKPLSLLKKRNSLYLRTLTLDAYILKIFIKEEQ